MTLRDSVLFYADQAMQTFPQLPEPGSTGPRITPESATPPRSDGVVLPRRRRERAAQWARRRLRDLVDALTVSSATWQAVLPDTVRASRRILPYILTSGFAAVLLPISARVLTTQYGLGSGIAVAVALSQIAPLLLALSRPLHAWWIVFPANILGALVLLLVPGGPLDTWPWPSTTVVAYLALCIPLGLRCERSTLVAVWLATTVTGLAMGQLAPARSAGSNVVLTVLSGALLLMGTLVRERGEARRKLTEQETVSETERARRMLLEERARIARELHDIVAHHMSVIAVQAASASCRVPEISKPVQEEFDTIAAASRESLAEMRRLLGALRSEESEQAQGRQKVPQPGLAQVPKLAESAVRAGVPVELSIAADTGRLSQTLELTAYRIIQEALANVVRHAPSAATHVAIDHEHTHLNILVLNGPPPDPAAQRKAIPLETAGTGHGLVGMHERIRLVDGTLDTCPLPDGGFRVAARIPLPGQSTTPPAAVSPATQTRQH